MAWELRAAWASGRRVSLTIDAVDAARVEGFVQSVAATGVFVVVAGLHVPVELILAVHFPSLLGDSTWQDGRWRAGARKLRAPGQLEIPGFDR